MEAAINNIRIVYHVDLCLVLVLIHHEFNSRRESFLILQLASLATLFITDKHCTIPPYARFHVIHSRDIRNEVGYTIYSALLLNKHYKKKKKNHAIVCMLMPACLGNSNNHPADDELMTTELSQCTQWYFLLFFFFSY